MSGLEPSGTIEVEPTKPPSRQKVDTSTAASSTDPTAGERLYTAEAEIRHPLRFLATIVSDTWNSRELAWRLFRRDLSAQYRQSLLGYIWAVLPPLGTTLIWVFLNKQGILKVGETPAPYPVFVLTGIVLWEAFSASLHTPLGALAGSAALMTKINFPKEAVILTAFGHAALGVGIRLALLAVLYAWYGVGLTWAALFAPMGLLATMALGFAVGLFLTPPSMLYHDVSRAMAVLTGPLFFLTPVIYPAPTRWPATILNAVNPISVLLTGTRDLLTVGSLPNPVAFWGVALGSFVAAFLGWVVCRSAMPHLIARLGA